MSLDPFVIEWFFFARDSPLMKSLFMLRFLTSEAPNRFLYIVLNLIEGVVSKSKCLKKGSMQTTVLIA